VFTLEEALVEYIIEFYDCQLIDGNGHQANTPRQQSNFYFDYALELFIIFTRIFPFSSTSIPSVSKRLLFNTDVMETIFDRIL
jgi:hypothetical protein